MNANAAESRILSEIKRHHLTCCICHELYKEPKALPCLHTFCLPCLQDFIYSHNYEPGDEFPCPMCRSSVHLTKEGVAAFPDNHLIVTMMDAIAQDQFNEEAVMMVPRPNLYPQLPVQLPSDTHNGPDQHVQVGNKQPVPKPRGYSPLTNVPTNRMMDNTRNQSRDHAPLEAGPLQRRLTLSNEQYPVQMERNKHGALVCFGQFGYRLTDFEQPVGLATSPAGDIIIGDKTGNRVFTFDQSGKLCSMFTCRGQIQDLTTDNDGLIYIANTEVSKSMVIRYNNRGHTMGRFGNFFTHEKPHGIAVMSDGHMVITSIETHLVYVLNEEGKLVQKFIGRGSDGKRLFYPYHVTVSKKDKIIVSDYGNNCIKIFDKFGRFKRQFGKSGAGPGQLNGPLGVCVDRDNNILVADSQNHRIQAFNSHGQLLKVVVQMTTADSQSGACPQNVAMTKDNKLVVLYGGSSYAQVRLYQYSPGTQ